MVPENGYFKWLQHSLISAAPVVPVGTTHIVFSTASASDVVAVVNSYLGGGTSNGVNMLIPTGTFVRIGNIVPGTSTITNVTINSIAPTATSVTFYQWNKEG